MLTGSIDELTRRHVTGWARDIAHPEAPVVVVITANGELVGRTVANTPRPDLVAAGIGTGTFSFSVPLRPPLAPGRDWLVHVRSEIDGRDVPGSPIRLPAASEFSAARDAFSAALDAYASEAELDERLHFLARERDRLLQRRADGRSGRALRPAGTAGPGTPPRALVIDLELPRPGHDGGSSAIVSHMQALRRLGYQVVFAARSMAGGADAAALEAEGIACCTTPFYASVEEVLRRDAGLFDLVYLHRLPIAAAYTTLVRQTQGRARLVYGVADLHHLRIARQAVYEDRPELHAEANRLRAMELWAAGMADAVITHSSIEAEMLRPLLPPGRVHVVAWSMPIRPRTRPFAERSGAALLGNFRHQPNVAAAWVLCDEIVPLLQQGPSPIACVLAGEGLPPGLATPRPGLRAIGHVPHLDDLFDAVRLTVAPLPYGAGLKGKVLASLAAGVPCVCSPIAAEGLDLPPRLQGLVAQDATAAAQLIRRLHDDEAFNTRYAKRCTAFAERRLSDAALDADMRRATGQVMGQAIVAARPGVT